ncbi:MAG: hypothetical protein ABR588_01340 [Sphingomicrobium sp.]|nr:hypothetical protein [Sphingomonadales bacterium]
MKAAATTWTRKAYRSLKWLAILIVAMSFAEFVAADMAFALAGDAVFYFELVLAGWAISAIAYLSPAIASQIYRLAALITVGPDKPNGQERAADLSSGGPIPR